MTYKLTDGPISNKTVSKCAKNVYNKPKNNDNVFSSDVVLYLWVRMLISFPRKGSKLYYFLLFSPITFTVNMESTASDIVFF